MVPFWDDLTVLRTCPCVSNGVLQETALVLYVAGFNWPLTTLCAFRQDGHMSHHLWGCFSQPCSSVTSSLRRQFSAYGATCGEAVVANGHTQMLQQEFMKELGRLSSAPIDSCESCDVLSHAALNPCVTFDLCLFTSS